MKDILSQISANRIKEVEAKYGNPSGEELLSFYKTHLSKEPSIKSMKGSIMKLHAQGYPGIIAEFKRRSPSKADIAPAAAVEPIVMQYEKGGAAACSILTDTRYFGGSLNDLAVARNSCALPLLRKDFIVSEAQIYEAAFFKANAILLIASILDTLQLEEYTRLAHQLSLEVLYEIHSIDELEKMPGDVDMVGVNNRKLSTFETNVDHSYELIKYLPKDKVLIAESGILTPVDIKKLRLAGFHGFLIGEVLMRNADPVSMLKDFIQYGAN